MVPVPHYTVPTVGDGACRETTIIPDGDFVIRLTPVTHALSDASANKPVVRSRIFEFRVSRGVLISHSTFFDDMFRVQPTLAIVSFPNHDISRAMEVWLRAIHSGAGNIPPSLNADRHGRVWDAIAVGQQFRFAPQHAPVLKPWFLAHYHRMLDNGPGLTPGVARTLAFPCAVFDHAEGFMKLTKYLAYSTNNTLFTEDCQVMGVDTRFLDGPLNAARTRIQSVLERDLYHPLELLHRARCACRKETAFDYEDALIALNCWPLDEAANKMTLLEVIEKILQFNFQPKVQSCSSGACSRHFNKLVEDAVHRAKHYFDGLCLDCVNRSTLTVGQPRAEYIKINSPDVGGWDSDCRFMHRRPSWYFSWMGPSSVRSQIDRKGCREANEKRLRNGTSIALGAKQATGRPRTTKFNIHSSTNRRITTAGLSGGAVQSPGGHNDKENEYDDGEANGLGIDDDDEFFDAEEETYLDHEVN